MDNDDFIKNLGKAYIEFIEKFEGIIAINPPQYRKFLEAAKRFEALIKEHDGTIKEVNLTPNELHGYLVGNIPLLDVWGKENIDNLVKLLGDVNVFAITPTNKNELFIEVTIPDVFVQCK